jgi:hypothetical protein
LYYYLDFIGAGAGAGTGAFGGDGQLLFEKNKVWNIA